MPNSSKPSSSIIAAAIVAILAGLFVLLCCSFAFFGTLLNTLPANSVQAQPFVRTAMLATLGFMMCLAIFGIATGIGLILLRNWARISALIWGGLCVFFGAVGIPVAFFIPLVSPENVPNLSADSMQAVRWILLFFYGLPLIAGIWWLILFNRKTVKAQFAATTTSAASVHTQKSRCPLPVAVLAWFYITSILNLLFLPFLPFHVPTFVFGRVLSGSAGVTVLMLSSLAFAAAGVGLLKLKPWSYSLTLGLQVFWLASGAVSVLSPNYNAVMESFLKDMQSSLHLPESQFSPPNFMHHFGWASVLGLLFAGAILGLLVYYRTRFLEAAAATASSS